VQIVEFALVACSSFIKTLLFLQMLRTTQTLFVDVYTQSVTSQNTDDKRSSVHPRRRWRHSVTWSRWWRVLLWILHSQHDTTLFTSLSHPPLNIRLEAIDFSRILDSLMARFGSVHAFSNNSTEIWSTRMSTLLGLTLADFRHDPQRAKGNFLLFC